MERIYLETVDSTNKWAKENINKILDKTLVYTFNQTLGRGRFDRVWANIGEDNIYASIVLKPSNKMEEVYSNLTQYLCVVLADVFEGYGVVPQIKWPNDIQINGKKISGILAEAVADTQNLKGIILGFGVNLNSQKEVLDKINQPATALNIEVKSDIDKNKFLDEVSERFCLLYDRFLEEGFPFIKNNYIRRANFLNKNVTVRVLENNINGFAKSVTDNGNLLIVDNNNTEQILYIGDIL